MPRLLSCFPTRTTTDASSDLNGKKPDCVFCNASVETDFKVVHEDHDLLAFKDRKPWAEIHLLIIPKKHAASTVRDLTTDHVTLITDMIKLGHQLSPAPNTKMGFHIPPFSSVPHLHLHVLAGKRTRLGKLKYPVSSRDNGKGWSWFVSAEQTLGILQKGGRIGISPC